MINITEPQRRELENAVKNNGGLLVPMTQAMPAGAQKKICDSLLKKKIIIEEEDNFSLTKVAYKMLGIEPPEKKDTSHKSDVSKKSKKQTLLDLVAQPNGATLETLQQATEWKGNSIRGTISNLIKKGHAIVSFKDNGERRYKIEPKKIDKADQETSE